MCEIVISNISNEETTIYKKVRILKDGTVHPLFIDKKKPFEFGKWLHCEFHPTNGFAERTFIDEDGNKIGCWHGTYKPVAPHIADELKSGEKRVWMECLAKGQTKTYERPLLQGGTWCLFEWIKPIRVLTDEEVEALLV